MSYEARMLRELKMPLRKDVEDALLKALFRHNGSIKEFNSGVEIVVELGNEFELSNTQKNAYLETVYRKENRVKKSYLWHRLLFRAADSLAKNKMVIRPTRTIKLTNKREWMLTENGLDRALKLLKVPEEKKVILPIQSYEVQKFVKKLNETSRPKSYNPINNKQKVINVSKQITLRSRAFRQAVISTYDYKCSICNMKISSPDSLIWEVEAAHIVPHRFKGKDDIWNGIALCHLHHWAFDVGWFTLLDNYKIQVSSRLNYLPPSYGKMGNYEFLKDLKKNSSKLLLPDTVEIYPHQNAIQWHRENIFCQ